DRETLESTAGQVTDEIDAFEHEVGRLRGGTDPAHASGAIIGAGRPARVARRRGLVRCSPAWRGRSAALPRRALVQVRAPPPMASPGGHPPVEAWPRRSQADASPARQACPA